MAKKMTWEEMREMFPDEWVALADYEMDGAINITGTVIAHDPDKKSFHKTVRKLMPKYHDIAVRFTGQLIKNPQIPLLGQITHTD